MKLKYPYASQQVADSFMAMAISDDPQAQNSVLRLNKSGKDMLDLLANEITEDEMVQRLLQQYEGDESVIRASVQKFVAELKAKNLLA